MDINQRKPRAMAALLIICAVALGALGGIAVDRLVLLPRVGHAGPGPAGVEAAESTAHERGSGRSGGHMGARPSGERYLRHLQGELDLTAEQTERIGEILRNQQERMIAITRETRPRIHGVAEDTRQAMRGVLTDEQWESFQELRRRGDRRDGRARSDREALPARDRTSGSGVAAPADSARQER